MIRVLFKGHPDINPLINMPLIFHNDYLSPMEIS